MRVLERMEKIGMPFLMHGEEVGPDIDIFDREAVFIDRRSVEMGQAISRPAHDHGASVHPRTAPISSKAPRPQVGGTITPYHLILTRTDWLGAGLKPMMYAMPVIKTARTARRCARPRPRARPAISSAPIPRRIRIAKKVAVNGVPGIFNAPVALETYAQVFEEEGALDKLEAFASLNGPKHYRLPPNEETIMLEKSPWTAPEEVKVAGPDERALVYRGGETIAVAGTCGEVSMQLSMARRCRSG